MADSNHLPGADWAVRSPPRRKDARVQFSPGSPSLMYGQLSPLHSAGNLEVGAGAASSSAVASPSGTLGSPLRSSMRLRAQLNADANRTPGITASPSLRHVLGLSPDRLQNGGLFGSSEPAAFGAGLQTRGHIPGAALDASPSFNLQAARSAAAALELDYSSGRKIIFDDPLEELEYAGPPFASSSVADMPGAAGRARAVHRGPANTTIERMSTTAAGPDGDELGFGLQFHFETATEFSENMPVRTRAQAASASMGVGLRSSLMEPAAPLPLPPSLVPSINLTGSRRARQALAAALPPMARQSSVPAMAASRAEAVSSRDGRIHGRTPKGVEGRMTYKIGPQGTEGGDGADVGASAGLMGPPPLPGQRSADKGAAPLRGTARARALQSAAATAMGRANGILSGSGAGAMPLPTSLDTVGMPSSAGAWPSSSNSNSNSSPGAALVSGSASRTVVETGGRAGPSKVPASGYGLRLRSKLPRTSDLGSDAVIRKANFSSGIIGAFSPSMLASVMPRQVDYMTGRPIDDGHSVSSESMSSRDGARVRRQHRSSSAAAASASASSAAAAAQPQAGAGATAADEDMDDDFAIPQETASSAVHDDGRSVVSRVSRASGSAKSVGGRSMGARSSVGHYSAGRPSVRGSGKGSAVGTPAGTPHLGASAAISSPGAKLVLATVAGHKRPAAQPVQLEYTDPRLLPGGAANSLSTTTSKTVAHMLADAQATASTAAALGSSGASVAGASTVTGSAASSSAASGQASVVRGSTSQAGAAGDEDGSSVHVAKRARLDSQHSAAPGAVQEVHDQEEYSRSSVLPTAGVPANTLVTPPPSRSTQAAAQPLPSLANLGSITPNVMLLSQLTTQLHNLQKIRALAGAANSAVAAASASQETSSSSSAAAAGAGSSIEAPAAPAPASPPMAPRDGSSGPSGSSSGSGQGQGQALSFLDPSSMPATLTPARPDAPAGAEGQAGSASSGMATDPRPSVYDSSGHDDVSMSGSGAATSSGAVGQQTSFGGQQKVSSLMALPLASVATARPSFAVPSSSGTGQSQAAASGQASRPQGQAPFWDGPKTYLLDTRSGGSVMDYRGRVMMFVRGSGR